MSDGEDVRVQLPAINAALRTKLAREVSAVRGMFLQALQDGLGLERVEKQPDGMVEQVLLAELSVVVAAHARIRFAHLLGVPTVLLSTGDEDVEDDDCDL